MTAPSRRNAGGGWWRRKLPDRLFLISGFLLVTSLLFLVSYSGLLRPLFIPFSLSPGGTLRSARFPQCGAGSRLLSTSLGSTERFLWYAPHSGFSNQLSELRNAMLLASILGRTLIVPPVLDHHAVALGSCPKFRVSRPSELRSAVWDHSVELLRSRRYLSMADIIDLSSLVSSSTVKVIDFRVFVSLWCGLDMDLACSGSRAESLPEEFKRCRNLLSGLEGNVDQCVYAVEEDCRTTIWTYGQDSDGILDLFQPDEELKKNKKNSYVRRRRDVYKALGPSSEAEMSTVVAFGSIFSAPYKGSELYIDIHETHKDVRIQSLLQKLEYLPFVVEILNAGRDFALNKIREPFLCAQLRLLDGQFKNHWKTTFSTLREKIEMLQIDLKEKNAHGPIHIFIMTDLPSANWTGSYLEELQSKSNSFKLYTVQEGDGLVMTAARKLMAAEHGLRSGFPLRTDDIMLKHRSCAPVLLPDILLYIEETICSCASLGFVGTAGSTIAESIKLMRRNNVCSSAYM